MIDNSNRLLSLKGTYNIRDLGGYQTESGNKIPWRKFLRADSLHLLNDDGMSYLQREGLRLVIDLRTEKEVKERPNPFANFSGVQFLNLPLFDDLAPIFMLNNATSGKSPLLNFYLAAIHNQHKEIKAVMTEISNVDEGAILFNCTAGKDRTGIVAALLLGLVGVSSDDIIYDYTLTAELIPELVKQLLEESKERGVNSKVHSRMLESPAEVIRLTLADLEKNYGSVSGYFESIGLNSKSISILRKRLTYDV